MKTFIENIIKALTSMAALHILVQFFVGSWMLALLSNCTADFVSYAALICLALSVGKSFIDIWRNGWRIQYLETIKDSICDWIGFGVAVGCHFI